MSSVQFDRASLLIKIVAGRGLMIWGGAVVCGGGRNERLLSCRRRLHSYLNIMIVGTIIALFVGVAERESCPIVFGLEQTLVWNYTHCIKQCRTYGQKTQVQKMSSPTTDVLMIDYEHPQTLF